VLVVDERVYLWVRTDSLLLIMRLRHCADVEMFMSKVARYLDSCQEEGSIRATNRIFQAFSFATARVTCYGYILSNVLYGDYLCISIF
jgi:hypothetical protein